MPKKRLVVDDPVLAYARAVDAGEIVAGPYVRLAAKRHLRDLLNAKQRGLRWSVEEALHKIAFVETFLFLGEDQPFRLLDYQKFILGSIYGWLRADGSRRFRQIYLEMGKGSGKTPLAAAMGLVGMVADGEPQAEIYSGAPTRDQAKICLRDAAAIVRQSKALSQRLEVAGEKEATNIADLAAGGFFRTVSSDHKTIDGPRPHVVILDEIHSYSSSTVIEKLAAGVKARRQPLVVMVTNSGTDRHSICWVEHEYSIKVLQGVLEDDGRFAYVCALDEGEDPLRDRSCWFKANPGLGTLLPERYLEDQVRAALAKPSERNTVLRLNFCIWTEATTGWLDMTRWREGCQHSEAGLERLRGMDVYAGLDLSSNIDLSALVLRAPVEDGPDLVEALFWCPAETVTRRTESENVPYRSWVDQGWIQATPGRAINHDYILEAIRRLVDDYGVRIVQLKYDRWGATQVAQKLEADGLAVVPTGQGFISLSEPSKQLEADVLEGAIDHGGNPVLTWMASNVTIETDSAGNIKPSKRASKEKIDGIVALVMATDGVIRAAPEQTDELEGEIEYVAIRS